MKLSSISCTVITLAALTCSVTAIPTHYPPSHHGEVYPANGQSQGTGAYRRDLEDQSLSSQEFLKHIHSKNLSSFQTWQASHREPFTPFDRSTHADAEPRDRRDLEDDEDLFARHEHNDPSGPVYRRGLEGRRLVARSVTQYNNYD